MSLLKRLIYMGMGGALVLALVTGGIVVLAQDDEPAEETPVPEVEADSEAEALPGPRFRREVLAGQDDELLAEALGITVEELKAARAEAYATAIEQAVDGGLLTEEQAEALLEGAGRFRHPFIGLADQGELLAEALGISVEELEAAQAEVRTARLAELVEAGVITQEEADLIAARQAVQTYVDREALAETLQNAYQAAIDAALADGAITEAQAEQLQENAPSFDGFNFFRRSFGGRGGHGPYGFRVLPGLELEPEMETEIFLPHSGAGA